jgi:hypothetical protein
MTYDGTWHLGPTSTDPFTIDTTPHGSLSACFPDGSGLLVYSGNFVLASLTEAPGMHMPTDFQGEQLFGAWSSGGAMAYTVGTFGSLLTRQAGGFDGAEVGPTVRHDILDVDVGTDNAVFALDALQPDRSSGGEVLLYESSVLTQYSGTGFYPPSIPVSVATIAKDDVWVLANDNSAVGIAHYGNDNTWSVTRFLAQTGDPLAIFASAHNDVWATATNAAWHYDGTTWNPVAVSATYRSIHGSAPNDVWFAGDGVAHWDGKTLTPIPALKGTWNGVWSSAAGRTWLWGDTTAVLWDGKTSTPVEKALGASAEWTTTGIAEAQSGDVFVLTKRGTGTALLWFDPSHTKLVQQVSSDEELWKIRGRGNQLWAVGAGGASLRFAPPTVN